MSKGAILVVDDESEIREGLELLLTSEGYGVSSAETGESGGPTAFSRNRGAALLQLGECRKVSGNAGVAADFERGRAA